MKSWNDQICDYTTPIWYGNATSSSANVTVWPINPAPVVTKARTALEWLRDQITEITEIATA